MNNNSASQADILIGKDYVLHGNHRKSKKQVSRGEEHFFFLKGHSATQNYQLRNKSVMVIQFWVPPVVTLVGSNDFRGSYAAHRPDIPHS